MNAIIMAAGTASRFVPLSEERPKGLLEVRGEILIERQIRQLREAGVNDITIVLGYKAELFEYLADKYSVTLVYNEDFKCYNNSSSVIRVIDKLDDTFLCCSDHYFERNVFLDRENDSYYAVQYAEGNTAEWCVETDDEGFIKKVNIGGANAWYLAGHVYFNPEFSETFAGLLSEAYKLEETRQGYWEDLMIKHLDILPIKIRKYSDKEFREFDSIDELRTFDESYISDTRSTILKEICKRLGCEEKQLSRFERIKHEGDYLLFSFLVDEKNYIYDGRTLTTNPLVNE